VSRIFYHYEYAKADNMADALALRHLNLEMLGKLRPSSFQWPVFLAGFILSVASCEKFLAAVKNDDKAGGRIAT
jgi:hypothetical protein